MNGPTFTLHDIFQFFLAFCGALITVAGAIGIIAGIVHKVKQPTAIMKNMIDDHERRITKHDEYLEQINTMLTKNKDENRATQKSLFAIMGYLLSEDNRSKEQLENARQDLQSFLIDK